MLRSVFLIEAPSNLGLKPPRPGVEPGVRRLPEALAAAGLGEAIAAARGGRVEPPPYSPEVDPETGIRNAPAIARYAPRLADLVGDVLDRGGLPLVLGGDCSILLGSLLALRRRGRYGLFFVDGHADFATPATSPSHGAAGMDLSLATGRGPALLASLEGLRPLVRDEDVVVVGYRDEETLPPAISAYRVDRLRCLGFAEVARREVARLRAGGVEGFWIHVDADVLDPEVMPAVDTPEPGGLELPELTRLLRELLASDLAAGIQVCIYDPDRDPDGSGAVSLVRVLGGALSFLPPAPAAG
jgi:arginase